MTDIFYETITPNRHLPFRLLIHDNGVAHHVLSHWHHSFEIAYVITGENTNFTVNGQHFDQSKGEVVVINPYEVHSLDLPTDHKRVALTVMLPNDILTASNIAIETHIQNRIPNDTQLQGYFNTLYQTTRHPATTGTQAEQIGLIYLILSCLVTHYSQADTTKRTPHYSAQMDHLSPVITWIDRHYQEKITVEKLAGIANLSASYFAHLFQKHLNQSPLVYVTSRRLLAAEKQLLTTSDSLEAIAFATGFPNVKALNMAFKHHFAQSPTQYRLSHQ